MKVLSRILMWSGMALLAFWVIAHIHSEVASAQALAAFSAARTTSASLVPDVPAVDTSLWSAKRIESFQKALGIKSDPPIAILSIPRIGVQAPVFRGTDDITLNRGVGWIDGTAFPGSKGNVGIAAHRDGFFRALKDISLNDAIDLETTEGVKTFYVRECKIVDPSQVEVLAPSTEQTLTLITCYPFYFVGSAPQRFIVRAVADSATRPKV
jgi:sortase A